MVSTLFFCKYSLIISQNRCSFIQGIPSHTGLQEAGRAFIPHYTGKNQHMPLTCCLVSSVEIVYLMVCEVNKDSAIFPI